MERAAESELKFLIILRIEKPPEIMVKKNILYTIGSTPMVRINALCPNPRVNIYAKLEGFNPTGSIKDRIAVRMVEAAIKSGQLTRARPSSSPHREIRVSVWPSQALFWVIRSRS